MITEIRSCEDGSHTLFSERVGECYHSIHGAFTESKHIFIQSGLQTVLERDTFKNILSPDPVFLFPEQDPVERESQLSYHAPDSIPPVVRILEVGLGTGLNALLTILAVEKEKSGVSYLGFEPFPILPATLQQLNYCSLLKGNSELFFKNIHESEWNKGRLILPNFYFQKKQVGFVEAELPMDNFDLIYFDAFSPEVQPELWTPEVFKKCYTILAKDGILVTYCAKGEVKRSLKSAGFIIENLPGPPGKREITRAHKKDQ